MFPRLSAVAAIAALFAFLMIFSGSASAASNIGMALSAERVSGCPGFAIPLELLISNNDDATHTYSLSLGMPQGWKAPDNGFMQPDVVLAAGESRKVTFWVNPPIVAPGVHAVRVMAKAGVDEDFRNLEIEVLRCHDVSLDVPPTIDMCAESEFQYTFSVANNGKEAEEFEIFVAGSWGPALREGSLLIEAGKKKDVAFKIVAPAESGRVAVTAKSKSSYAAAERSTLLNVKKCYDFDASVVPTEGVSCLGGSAKFMLTIRNEGTAADTYALKTPSWVTPAQANLTVPPGESREIELAASPEARGRTRFDMILGSKGFPSLVKNISATVEAGECKGVAVIISPASQETCKGGIAEFSVSVKNTGLAQDTYEVNASAGTLEANKVSAGPGETKELRLSVDTGNMKTGENAVTVTARSGGVIDRSTVGLALKDCYRADFAVSPESASVCEDEEVKFKLTIRNAGELADNYTFGLGKNNIGYINLAPGESKAFETVVRMTGLGEREDHDLKFTLVSKHLSLEAVSSVTVKPREACYKVEIASEAASSRVEPGNGIAVMVSIRNKGEKPDSYVLELEGPSWVHLSQSNVSLGPGETSSVYLYASPGYEVAKNTYGAVMKARSANSGGQDFPFLIGVGVTPEGVTNETGRGPPTGAIIAGGNGGKVILLAFIVLLILAILVVKFVLFVK